MEKIKNINELRNFIVNNKIALLYVSSWECGVCRELLPKIEMMLNKYLSIVSRHVEISEIPEVAGELSIFTTPVILMFIEGKEIIRESRYVMISDLEDKIDRFITLLN